MQRGMEEDFSIPADAASGTSEVVRVDQADGAITLRFMAGERLWELLVPDENVTLSHVRVVIREFSQCRGAEASTLVPWSDYLSARTWLRCIPDGYCNWEDLRPATTYLDSAFSSLKLAVSFNIPSVNESD